MEQRCIVSASDPTQPPPRNRRLDRRRPPRGRVRVVCQRGSLELGANLALALLDLSETGALLLIKEALEKGREVSLALEQVGTGRTFKRVGIVAWSAPLPDGKSFRAGVAFQKRLEYREIRELT